MNPEHAMPTFHLTSRGYIHVSNPIIIFPARHVTYIK